jgi:hypothetical protein
MAVPASASRLRAHPVVRSRRLALYTPFRYRASRLRAIGVARRLSLSPCLRLVAPPQGTGNASPLEARLGKMAWEIHVDGPGDHLYNVSA